MTLVDLKVRSDLREDSIDKNGDTIIANNSFLIGRIVACKVWKNSNCAFFHWIFACSIIQDFKASNKQIDHGFTFRIGHFCDF